MAVVVENRNGKMVTLLNPSEKARKFSVELRSGRALTNNNKRKWDKNGKEVRLTKEQRAFRAGYLQSRKDSAKAFKANHPRYKRKTA